jgi:hypothetical protein
VHHQGGWPHAAQGAKIRGRLNALRRHADGSTHIRGIEAKEHLHLQLKEEKIGLARLRGREAAARKRALSFIDDANTKRREIE